MIQIYDEMLTFEHIKDSWNIVRKTCKNKKAIAKFYLNQNTNIMQIYKELKQRTYKPYLYHVFLIFEPKARIVMSQQISDKVVNHFVTNYYLLPFLENKLVDCNVATRKGKGSSYALNLLEKYIHKIRMLENGKEIFVLKLDISKYFYTIDHSILLDKLRRDGMDEDVISLIEKIIGETNKDYVNKNIKYYNEKYSLSIPYYEKNVGLSIGAMSSQFLAIYYLNDLDHYIKQELRCKYYVRYMDDFVLLSTDKSYLKYIWMKIEKVLESLKLTVNKKSNIYRLSKGVTFLGYRYKVCKGKLKVSYNKKTYKKIKSRLEILRKKDKIKYFRSCASYYGYLSKDEEMERRFKMSAREKYECYKQKYPKSIVLVKEGLFYKIYGDDAIILWHLFGYKWNQNSISFGSNPYMKVLDKLNELSLSYHVISEEDFGVIYSDEIYDLRLKIATIEYDKFKKKEELDKLLKQTLNLHINQYEKIKEFLLEINKG